MKWSYAFTSYIKQHPPELLWHFCYVVTRIPQVVLHAGHGTVISPAGRAGCGRAASILGPHPLKANGAPELPLSNFQNAFLGAVLTPARLTGVGWGLGLVWTLHTGEDLLMGSLSKLASRSLFLLKWEITDLPSEEYLRRKCPDVPAVPNSNLAQSRPSTSACSFLCTWTNLSYKGPDHKSLGFAGHTVSGSHYKYLALPLQQENSQRESQKQMGITLFQ